MEYNHLIDLITTVSKSNLKDFRYEDGETKVIMSSNEKDMGEAAATCVSQQQPKQETPDVKEGKIVTSPLVGTFYRTPSEEAAAFVEVGDLVKKGQVLAIVEAMKLMNEIESEYDGEIQEVYPESGTMVEYGQPLFRIL
ncbi:MAG: acetyl-CoA carboxylase biotin carboxyl carrier protein [bacterium]|nr:acetyl-CoA carboxylase biotin carboxyl carrier protein [bacterium]